ncbi:MAG TPA: response regulator [Thermoanaerobaculia bacterium]|nr:response regulator [Thermoanaerobaculia bacterium]
MSRRILLADDSVTIQKVIELTFMDDDYEVRAVGNGDEALAMLSALEVDFVIADIHMPGADGYEVCRQSKQRHPEVPVLLLVGTFEPFDEKQAKDSGADSFLKKPFDSQELLQRVHELLAAKAQTPGALSESAGSLPGAAQDVQATPQAQPSEPPQPPAGEPAPAVPSPPLHAPPSQAGFYAAPSPLDGAGAEPLVEPSWEGFELEAEPEPHFAELPDLPEPAPSQPAPSDRLPLQPERRFAFGDHQPFPLPDERPASLYERRRGGDSTVAQPDQQEVEHGGQPFSFDEPLQEHVFDLEPVEAPATEAAASRWSSQASARDAPSAAPPPTLEERAGAPAGPAPFAASLPETAETAETAETVAKIEEHQQAPPPLISAGAASRPEAAASAEAADSNGGGRLSDGEVERIARRVVELIGDKVVRDIAWEVIPDLAEVVIKDRLRELESQIE